MMQRFWANLDPNKKRFVVIGAGVVGLFAVVSLFSGAPDKGDDRRNRQESIKHVLTDRDTREVGLDALSADLRLVTRENDALRRELDRLKRELESVQTKASATNEVSREVARLRQEVEDLRKQDKTKPATTKGPEEGEAGEESTPSITKAVSRTFADEIANEDPEEIFRKAPLPSQKSTPEAGAAKGETAAKGVKIISHAEDKSAAEVVAGDEGEDMLFLPAGSILTGVLINGMDAPTARGARRDPFPSTLRIQKEAILPNRFRADVRECFAIISGYGDLSSERAYLRGETISCVRNDGGVIEARLDSYAVGEDGKAGVRGRLVSKQGQIIAKSMLAGFLSGVSDAFDVNPVPVLSTSPGSSVQYQQVFSQDMFQGAAVKGASKALDRIAQFYIEMAENIFPVIEVDAGRQIDLIISRGTKLQIRSGGK